jgi:hypothetical protein
MFNPLWLLLLLMDVHTIHSVYINHGGKYLLRNVSQCYRNVPTTQLACLKDMQRKTTLTKHGVSKILSLYVKSYPYIIIIEIVVFS